MSTVAAVQPDSEGEASNRGAPAVPEARIRPFDFARRETVERSRLRSLSDLFDTLAHRFASAASSEIRQTVHFDFEPDGIDQLTWEEIASSLPEIAFISTVVIPELEGRFLLYTSQRLIWEMLDYYFGGDARRLPDRPQLTELERAIFSEIIEVILGALPAAFGGLMDISIGAIQHNASPLTVPFMPNEICLTVRCNVAANEQDAEPVLMVLPISAVSQIIDVVESHQDPGLQRIGNPDEAGERLEYVPTEVRISYPSFQLTTEEILALDVGRFFILNDGAELPPVQLVIGSTPIATAAIDQAEDPMLCRILAMEGNQ